MLSGWRVAAPGDNVAMMLPTLQVHPAQAGHPPLYDDLPGTLCAAAATAGLLAEYSFLEPLGSLAACHWVQAMALLAFVATRLARRTPSPKKGPQLQRYWLDATVLPAAAIAAALCRAPILATVLHAGVAYIALRQAGCLIQTLLERAVQTVVRPVRPLEPIRLLIGWYLALAVLGGLFLALPRASTADHRNAPFTHLLNSAFNATSAVCTAGLTVYDVPRDYTLFGKIVLLTLVQLGGLSMLIFGVLFGMLLVGRLSHEASGPVWMDPPRIRRLLRAILATTLVLEFLGTALLLGVFPAGPGTLQQTFPALFHAVNAFCNCGFALQADSLAGLAGSWQAYGVILPLAVLGSLGFPTLYEIVYRLRRHTRDGDPLLALPLGRWSLHSRLVLLISLCLVVGGMLGLLLFETPGQVGYWYVGKGNLLAAQDAVQLSPDWMRSHEGPQRMFDALFQAAVAPSTGLRTVPIDAGAISPASQVLLMMLIFVGGAPASTAGGIKTIAMAVVILYAISIFRRKTQPEAFGLQIPTWATRAALGVFLASLGWLTATILVLAHTERAGFLSIVFEAVSALGSSGLSLGLTPALTPLGKGIVLATMLAGRVGPLALVIWLAQPVATDTRQHPSEPLILG
jgi:trk system potassium uptake protein